MTRKRLVKQVALREKTASQGGRERPLVSEKVMGEEK